MKNVKTFENWLAEDFAQVGVAPDGNMGGTMGNPVAPTSNSVGSGDAWPSLFQPTRKKSKRVCQKCGKVKKRCKCKS